MRLLDRITCPSDVAALPESCLPELAGEIRDRLITSVSRTGGHLGPNLGVVELTIALHRVFTSPRDPILWDTGHQSYVHKMLTGRCEQFDGLRQAGGLAGYPQRSESEHDHVENSHASTALSYLDGLAKAFAVSGQAGERTPVAVVGDGSLTGGMAWEALNNIAAAPQRPAVIVLNDNGRSYAPTAGAIGIHLATLREDGAHSLFEQLGLAYVGPIDGHDVPSLEAALRKARDLRTPVVVHCVTVKGRGYPAAIADLAEKMHSIGPISSGSSGGAAKKTWTDVFSAEMVRIGEARPDVVAISAAMLGPTGLQPFADRFPERTFDVGIAEQHAVTSAAGLALGGLHPVVAVYSTFLNRAFDQVMMDVALHRLPVTFVLDRAGITGTDGPSHHGMWDLTLLGTVPGMRVAAPRDGDQLGMQLAEAVADESGPTALRFPKADVGPALPAVGHIGSADVLHIGSADRLHSGSADRPHSGSADKLHSGSADRPHSGPHGVLLIAIGALGGAAVPAAEHLAETGLAVTVVDPRWLLPVDADLARAAADYALVVTVEDSGAHGGYGDAFTRALRTHGVDTPVRTLALAQEFIPHAARGAILAERALDTAGIEAAVLGALTRS